MKILISHLDPKDKTKWVELRLEVKYLEELDEYLNKYSNEQGLTKEHFLQMFMVER